MFLEEIYLIFFQIEAQGLHRVSVYRRTSRKLALQYSRFANH